MFFLQIIAGFVGQASAVVARAIDPTVNASVVVIAVILIMLAGMTSTGAVVDAIMGWSLTALGRLTEAVVNTLGLVIGIRAGMLISARLGAHTEINTDVVLGYFPLPIMLLACAFVAISFSIVAQSEAKVFAPAALTAMVAWIVFSFSQSTLGLGIEWASGMAALFSGLLGTVFARLQRVSIDSFAVTAILPLVPGLSIYKGLWALDESLNAAMPFLFTAAATAVALAIGLTFGSYVSSSAIASLRHARDHLLPVFRRPFSRRERTRA